MNWAYIAGFFDGEGSVCQRGRNAPGANISQKDRAPLYAIKEFLDKRGIISCLPRANSSHGVTTLSINRKESVVKFLRGVMPYLIVKRRASEDVWRFLTLFPSRMRKIDYPRSDMTKLEKRRWAFHNDPIARKAHLEEARRSYHKHRDEILKKKRIEYLGRTAP